MRAVRRMCQERDLSDGFTYALPGDLGVLTLSSQVLQHFTAHRQRKLLAREAGGQLFATFADPSVMAVVEATGPRKNDKRSVFSYRPDRMAERAEIEERFARGLHFVGDWHTHRERVPNPSDEDKRSIIESVHQSAHDLAGFLLVVVGQVEFPDGLHVSFHSRDASVVLTPLTARRP
jgi:integrative and conjugative element protein (TIGR02256 family)